MNRGSVVPVVVALLFVSSGTVAVTDGEPIDAGNAGADQQTGTTNLAATADFELVSTASNAPVDGTGSLSVTLANAGDTVRNASVVVQSPNESIRFGPSQNASRFVGEWSSGEQRTVRFDLLVEEFAEIRSYPFEAFVVYTAANGSRQRAGPYTFEVRPAEPIRLDRFEVTGISSDVQTGDTGTISVTLENTGSDVEDAVVTLQSRNGQLRLGRSANATRFVSDWGSGEDVTFDYHVTAGNDTVGGSYPFTISVSYREGGRRNQSTSRVFGVVPAPEQSFSLGDVNSTLRVGDEGVVTGTVTNEGPQVAPNAVLVIRSQSDTAFPKEREYALGTLGVGESVPVRYRIDVSDSADRGPRQLSFVVRYQNQEGDPRQSKPLEARVAVGQRRDEFVVRPIRTTVDAGGSATVTLRVTNNEDRTLRSIDARAFVDSPLTLDDDQAFVPRLEPNESANISFRVGADGGALAGTYPLSLDFQYEQPDGETRLSDTYEVPVRVTTSEGDGLLSFAGGVGSPLVLLVVLLGVGVVAVVAVRRWR